MVRPVTLLLSLGLVLVPLAALLSACGTGSDSTADDGQRQGFVAPEIAFVEGGDKFVSVATVAAALDAGYELQFDEFDIRFHDIALKPVGQRIISNLFTSQGRIGNKSLY